MPGEVTRYFSDASGGAGSRRELRQTMRTISRFQARAAARTSFADIEADVALAQQDALTTVTGGAMQSIVRVVGLQRQLEQIAPEAAGHLAAIVQMHVWNMGEVMQDARRAMR